MLKLIILAILAITLLISSGFVINAVSVFLNSTGIFGYIAIALFLYILVINREKILSIFGLIK